jgi:osmotically-inducible protein OsmY
VNHDDKIRQEVESMLASNPRVDAPETAVSVEEGAVRLRGTVGSLGAKRNAERAAKRVPGVSRVENELEVRPLAGHRRNDAELRGVVLRALSSNAWVPDDVNASVVGGIVTLRGTVDFRHQRDEAAAAVVDVPGVTGIYNGIKVRNVGLAEDASARIESAFRRNAELDARAIKVEILDGTATLTGQVNSWLERNAAIDAVWTTPGVQDVEDKLIIAG